MVGEGIKKEMKQRTENKENWQTEIIGKIEVIIGGKMEGVCGEGMGGMRRGREEYRRVGGYMHL